MNRVIEVNNTKIQYDLQYKKVKNINLRIKSDGSICVSAYRKVPQSVIDDFVISKAKFIFRTISKMQEKSNLPKTQYYTESEVKELIIKLCKKVYPYYEEKGIKYPQIKFRKMVSQWGNCYPKKGILTFNTNLMYADGECIEYVVYHEFTHFLQANHSSKFYATIDEAWAAAIALQTTETKKATITLLDNCTAADVLHNQSDYLVLNTNGKTLTICELPTQNDYIYYSGIKVSGGSLMINGNGKVTGLADGNYYKSIIYAGGGVVYVDGAEFHFLDGHIRSGKFSERVDYKKAAILWNLILC